VTDNSTPPALAPGVARGRRAFFAPVWLTLLGFLLFGLLSINVWRSQATSTVIMLRHAEKQLGTISDAPLSLEGERRAESLARLFGGGKAVGMIEAIYVSDTRRAKDTVKLLAEQLGLTPIVRDPADAQGLANELLERHRGRVVLVVGHSNTIPPLLAELTSGRVAIAIGENDYGQAWVVSRPSFGPASVVQLRY
jgi:2,3-bisphosphoglycerate-dependent phosphoglycerate mutase